MLWGGVLNYEWFLRLLGAALVVVITYYIARVTVSYIKRARIQAPPEIIENIARAVKATLLVIGVLIALSILRVDLTGFVLAAGFAGIVVGLAAQQTLSHFFAGLALILGGFLKIGDAVRVDGDWGVVEAVGFLATRIRLWSGEILVIPNGTLMSSRLYNYSLTVARRVEVTIGVSYTSDLDRAVETVRKVLWDKELVLAEPQPLVIVDSLGDGVVIMKIMFWVPSSHFLDVRKEIIGEIKRALESEGIEIPYPQRVVWLKTGEQPS